MSSFPLISFTDNTTDWFSKYKAEHALRLKGETKISELQGKEMVCFKGTDTVDKIELFGTL